MEARSTLKISPAIDLPMQLLSGRLSACRRLCSSPSRQQPMQLHTPRVCFAARAAARRACFLLLIFLLLSFAPNLTVARRLLPGPTHPPPFLDTLQRHTLLWDPPLPSEVRERVSPSGGGLPAGDRYDFSPGPAAHSRWLEEEAVTPWRAANVLLPLEETSEPLRRDERRFLGTSSIRGQRQAPCLRPTRAAPLAWLRPGSNEAAIRDIPRDPSATFRFSSFLSCIALGAAAFLSPASSTWGGTASCSSASSPFPAAPRAGVFQLVCANEQADSCNQTADRFRTRLTMTRSRSKPIYRAAHPGLKQLILREKFWARFDPNRNKLLHTPEYQELLVSERRRALQKRFEELKTERQREGGGGAGAGGSKAREASVISACLREQPEESGELSAEQKQELHTREVGYLRQQPKFRQKKWGSGRFKKEEGYLFRLLDSHRQKLLAHEKRKRQRHLAAERLKAAEALGAANAQPEGDADSADEALSSEEEGRRRKIMEAYKTLSYSFVITQVVPRLAWLEQQRQKDAIEAWNRRSERSPHPRTADTAEIEAVSSSLLHQVQRLHQRKKRFLGPQQVLSVYEQQQMLLGNVGFIDPVAERKRTSGIGKNEEDERTTAQLRIAAARTRSIYLQFVSDLHFIFTSFEEFLTDGLEALLSTPGAPDAVEEGDSAAERQLCEESESSRDGEGATNSEEAKDARDEQGEAARPEAGVKTPLERTKGREEWRTRSKLEEFVSALSFQKGFRSADDLFSVCHLLQRNPPAPSGEAQLFVLRLADLMQKDFIRALARVYHFHKEWSVAGRFFLAALTTRQQLLPKKLKLTMWDADTDSLELAIDILSLSWTPAEKAAFLDELQYADADAEAALAAPLLEGIRAALKEVMRQNSEPKKTRRSRSQGDNPEAGGQEATETTREEREVERTGDADARDSNESHNTGSGVSPRDVVEM
ncbi:hypothetical protein BESB_002790 [Besnoitia besnoiti]|uniref:Transmembrane protein n=1 Tax=Besnoitia besnoiti TaxID=94643 RepID=A0A2A9MHC9_BESBE|nr:hypothetical protein BESB_002790 [Besnoitia besnoiti]PFH37938.1 hypothetical protein BESB_002790 [Besnoitia besnoiti]